MESKDTETSRCLSKELRTNAVPLQYKGHEVDGTLGHIVVLIGGAVQD